ncbi:MAG TPA: NifU family protein [Gemmatales bacterium]|nr:NifU family protein [Gemmatales bacterium]
MTTSGANLHDRIAEAFQTSLIPAMREAGLELKFGGVDTDGVVAVQLQGACQSCPSTAMSLIMGIERQLIELVPEVAYIEITPER